MKTQWVKGHQMHDASVVTFNLSMIRTYHPYTIVYLQEKTYLYRTSLYLAASASAEFFADIALCPMESVKVRVQTAPASEGWGTTLRECAPRLWQREGISG